MSTDVLKILIVVMMTVLCAGRSSAQSSSIGTSFSFSGVGFCYDRDIREGTFIDIALKAETGEFLMDRASVPGISASFTWNSILAGWKVDANDTVDFFAGPGIHIGWSRDFRKETGFVFGLKGSVGLRFRFAVNAEISLCVSPVIGIHASMMGETIKTECYRYGLLNAVIPEAGIRYRF